MVARRAGSVARRQTLGLWMNGDFVGTWRLDPRAGDVLQYGAEWQAAPHGRPVSLSLPFMPGAVPHRGDVVGAYFDNLLPDSQEIRTRAARRFRARSARAFDLLAEIGRDCVGALQILPDGETPGDVHVQSATPLNESQIASLLRGTVASPVMSGAAPTDQEEFRISIAGAQEKTALAWIDGRWCLPHGSTPTTHILKLPMGLVGNMKLDLSHSIENEWLCSLILAAYGLPVAQCEPLQFEDMKVLAVKRFDRVWLDGPSGRWLARLPQEDFCQATATPPALKYESDGGPGIERIMAILANSEVPQNDRRTFLIALIVFWMLRAPDGHAKNFSLAIRPKGAYRLTPLYDVMSAWPLIGEGQGQLSEHKIRQAMAIRSTNAHWRMKEVQRRHWLELGKRYGVLDDGGRQMDVVIDGIVARTPGVIAETLAALPRDFPEHVASPILLGLERAARQLAEH